MIAVGAVAAPGVGLSRRRPVGPLTRIGRVIRS
jgi:hypothetical protein